MSAITPLPGRPLAPAPLEPGSATPSTARAAPAPSPSRADARPSPDPAAVQRAVAELQQKIDDYAREPREVAMRYDGEHRLVVIEIRDRSSGELIFEYPPEKILNVRDRLDELIGAMLDRKS